MVYPVLSKVIRSALFQECGLEITGNLLPSDKYVRKASMKDTYWISGIGTDMVYYPCFREVVHFNIHFFQACQRRSDVIHMPVDVYGVLPIVHEFPVFYDSTDDVKVQAIRGQTGGIRYHALL